MRAACSTYATYAHTYAHDRRAMRAACSLRTPGPAPKSLSSRSPYVHMCMCACVHMRMRTRACVRSARPRLPTHAHAHTPSWAQTNIETLSQSVRSAMPTTLIEVLPSAATASSAAQAPAPTLTRAGTRRDRFAAGGSDPRRGRIDSTAASTLGPPRPVHEIDAPDRWEAEEHRFHFC